MLDWVIFILGIIIMVLCGSKKSVSKFAADTIDSSVTPLNSISNDSVLIFYAPWCGHCKDKMGQFKDAVRDGGGKVILIDATDDSNKDKLDQYNIKGFPTIMKASGEKYSGPRYSDDIIKFANS